MKTTRENGRLIIADGQMKGVLLHEGNVKPQNLKEE